MEILIRLDNKGFVDHKIRKLNVSVHALSSETALNTNQDTGALQFDKILLKDTDIVPEKLAFFFVRPGVHQIVSHVVPIEGNVSLISIRARFDYDRKGYYPHTSRHIFATVSDNGPCAVPRVLKTFPFSGMVETPDS
ncbi:hypothetical protein [Terriglobus roseus]|uniref:hypothetical protein n=1 Tax=Terriglobus roseus TaxID=392734 RepID=UPI0012EAD2CC|nr:hypothetical protein [Terriglobus roseus]